MRQHLGMIRQDGGLPVRDTARWYPSLPCPVCGQASPRFGTARRTLTDIREEQAMWVHVRLSKHRCPRCRRFFRAPAPHGPWRGRFTFNVIRLALGLVRAKRLTFKEAARALREKYFVRVAHGTIHNWTLDHEELAPEPAETAAAKPAADPRTGTHAGCTL